MIDKGPSLQIYEDRCSKADNPLVAFKDLGKLMDLNIINP
jgi:hypothetical protein